MTDTQWLDGYLLSKAGAEHDFKVEWGWDRYMVRGKLFAAICRPEGMKDERYNGHPLVNLKCDPRRAELLRQKDLERRVAGRGPDRRADKGTL